LHSPQASIPWNSEKLKTIHEKHFNHIIYTDNLTVVVTYFVGETVDMLDCFSKLTLEITLSTAFSVDAKMQTGENTEILEKAKAVLRMPYIVLQTARLPFGNLYFRLMAALRGSQPAYLQAVTSEIIKKRRQQGITGRQDLLEFMMMASEETAVGKISRLTDDEILAQSLVFFLDGYDTANNTLTFTLYHLVLHPDIQDKLRSEINEAMETNVRKTPLFEIARNIEYLDCVIKEAQRLCPPAAQVGRECAEDFDLNGIHIPAGTEIVIPIYVMHHDPDAWEDPEKFDPERFRGPGKNTRHAFQFLPFGAGPRQCIGMTFALMEIKIALVKILMKFKFVLSPETQVPLEIHPGLNLTAKDGVLVRVLAL